MLSVRLRGALALLCLSALLCRAAAAPRDAKLRQLLLKSPLIPPVGKQDLARYTLAELLAELAEAENEALDASDDFPAEQQEVMGMELERAAAPVLAPRERKAGCKNFFWKTFTSC